MTKKLVSFDDQAEPGEGLPAAVKAELSATYGSEAWADPESPVRQSAGEVLAVKAASKADGQNVRNLRRPTLAVDKTYPNARADHQIVWADETLKMAYAISHDQRLYKSTWTSGGDEALVFGATKSGAAEGKRWAAQGVFLRLPDGTLLMEETDGPDTNTKLVRSTNDGASWTTVWTTPGDGKRFLGPQSVARDDKTGYLYLVEYTTIVAATTVSIWRSTDNGATWTEWVSKPRSDAATTGYLRHWHSCRYDPISERMYFMAGDTNLDAGIYRTTADGSGIEPVVLNSDIEASLGIASAARAVDVMFFPTHIVWAADGQGGPQNHVLRMDRASLGGTPVVEQVAAIDNTGWYAQRASADGSTWIVSTSTETSSQFADADAGVVHLYAVTLNGSQVDQVASIEMGGNQYGYASISGLGGGSGGGNAFWLRAHSYQFYPHRATSAFQMRSRLAWGVVPIIKPINQRPDEYVRQSVNWAGTLTPGQSLIFAHTRAGERVKALSLLEFGARTWDGTFGAARLEIWNATTNTKVYEFNGSSWRANSFSDTAARWAAVPTTFANRDEVQFRVVNTDAANPITCTVNCTYGWAWQ